MKKFWKYTKKILIWTFSSVVFLVVLISVLLSIYRDDIIDYAVHEINKNLKSPVEVEEIDLTFWSTFPNLSIDFNGVFIRDALPQATKVDTLLAADQVRLMFNPIDVWNEKYNVKQFQLTNANVYLKVNDKSEINYDILKPSEEKGDNAHFNVKLERIELKNVQFGYSNSLSSQAYRSRIYRAHITGNLSDKAFVMHTESELLLQEIRNGKIPFVVKQPATTSCDVSVNTVNNEISIQNGQLSLAGLPFEFNVNMDSTNIHTEVKAKQLKLDEVANKLTAKAVEDVKAFQGKGSVHFSLVVDNGITAEAYPKMNCVFGIIGGSLKDPESGITLNGISLDGKYSTLNGQGKEILELKNARFNSPSGPFNGFCTITEFNAPKYVGAASGTIQLPMLHALFKLPHIQHIEGNVAVQAKFKLHTEMAPVTNTAFVVVDEGSGSMNFHQVHFQLVEDSRKFSSINGTCFIDKTSASFSNLGVQLGQSDLQLSGVFNDVDAFLQDRGPLQFELATDSKFIDLNDFNNTATVTTVGVPQEGFVLPLNMKGSAVIDVRKLSMNQHDFTQLHGDLNLYERSIVFKKIAGKSAGVAIQGGLTVLESKPEYFNVQSSLTANEIHFKPLFKEWNNFDQSVITSENISGKAEAVLDFKAPFDLKNGILKDQLIAQIQLKVSNGALKNVQTFKDLTADLKTPQTRLILKPDEVDALSGKLNDIRFQTLENTIYIKNSQLIIPKMEIKSSALDITTEGTHSFDNRIDYRFAFRLRDLKQKRDESEFGEIIDDGTGVKVFVRMHGTLDNPIIEWDKTGRKQIAQENRQAAMNDAKSILKQEFGLFKKDTTVKFYQPKTAPPREELIIKFGEEEQRDSQKEQEEKKQKQRKINDAIDRMKKQQQENTKEEFKIE